MRRIRPGPGGASYSPFQPPPSAGQDPSWLDHEVGIIERALSEQGQLPRRELARRIGAHYWGPGRFRAPLREAVAEGGARRVGRNVYAPAGDAGSSPDEPPGRRPGERPPGDG